MNEPVPVSASGEATPAAAYSGTLVFWLNGRKVTIPDPDPTVLLTDYLHGVGLTGTKVGCGQGGCGTCTVMLSHRDPEGGAPVHRAVNACLRPLCAIAGMRVTTTEGIGSVHGGLDPVQHCLAADNGSQCGYCTPGFVMNAHAFLQRHPAPTQQEIEDLFGGNLCRCTGYRPILQGVRTLARDYHAAGDRSQKCLIDPSFPIQCKGELTRVNVSELPASSKPLHFTGSGVEWYRLDTLAEVHRLKRRFVREAGREQVKLVFGNTASGVYPHEKPRYLIDISGIPELARRAELDSGLHVGAAVPIQSLIEFAAGVVGRRPPGQTAGLQALTRHAGLIAGYQVRCAGSVAGNIFMATDHARRGEPFPSDLFTVLAALGTTITIASGEYQGGSHPFALIDMPAVETLPDDAVILSFEVPYTRPREYVQTYRVARRPQMSHPIVNAGFRLRSSENGCVEEAVLVYGGLASLAWRAARTEQFLSGKQWDKETLRSALVVLKGEVLERTIPMAEEGISTEYRRQLAEIDVLTGEFTILRADLLYDAGKSPNPALDVGQIEGGYVQGVGFATTEEVVYDGHGRLVTDNIWSYKPPCSKTIPLDFRVRLHPVDEARNAREALGEKQAVKSSKTAGEPGLTLGLSAYFAIKRAVLDARRELTGRDDWLSMDLPATCQRIQTNCGVSTESLTL